MVYHIVLPLYYPMIFQLYPIKLNPCSTPLGLNLQSSRSIHFKNQSSNVAMEIPRCIHDLVYIQPSIYFTLSPRLIPTIVGYPFGYKIFPDMDPLSCI